MHVGKTYPYELTLRVFMGEYTYPNWVRQQYEAIPAIVLPWFGPDSAQITNPGPYTIDRTPTLETSIDHFVFAGFVQAISSGVVYIGFEAYLDADNTVIRVVNQTWLDGAPQLVTSGRDYHVSSWAGFTSGTLFYTLLPGARIGGKMSTYNAVPW